MMAPGATQGHAGAIDLTPVQRAAVAKLVYGTERPGTLAVLCGPAGTGVSLVLESTARAIAEAGRTGSVLRLAAARATTPVGRHDVLLIDDAHTAGDGELAAMVERCRAEHHAMSIVLGGAGRLLTLLTRDSKLEGMVRLRAVLTPMARAETRRVAASILGTALPDEPASAATVIEAIHEIAGGIPAGVVRLSELAAVVAAGQPGHAITADDIELVHRRLAITAA